MTQIIGDPKADPSIPALIPIGRSMWWHWIKIGKAFTPIKLGSKITARCAEDIPAFVEQLSGFEPENPAPVIA